MKLNELAAQLPIHELIGNGDVEITGMRIDSRKVSPGEMFVCVPGFPNLKFVDRHEYAADAAANGASALLVERKLDIDVPQLLVKNVRYAMAVLACHFYRYPSLNLNVIGITGTNGKTTTSYLIEGILRDHGRKTGVMGSLGLKIGDEVFPYEGNTLDSPDLQSSFRQIVDSEAETCIMEVSSHGLELGRVLGTNFKTGVFTNLTQDHLDFHLTMDNYRVAKGLLFSRLGNAFGPKGEGRRFAVLNADDEASAYFARITPAQVVTYGIDRPADVAAHDVSITSRGTSFVLRTFVGDIDITMKLVGRFNVYNALAAIALGLTEDVPLSSIRDSLASINPIEGRMEVVDVGQPFLVLVDYAHTPDGLDNALSTIREVAEKKVITVFGCGGDRDRTKRPIMGGLAAKYSDYVIVTSDNPRTEDPDAILRDIEPGVVEAGYATSQYEMIVDRRQAIQKAIEMAGPGDVLLIAGKGHETYQLIQGETHHFDDREEAREAIRRIRS